MSLRLAGLQADLADDLAVRIHRAEVDRPPAKRENLAYLKLGQERGLGTMQWESLRTREV